MNTTLPVPRQGTFATGAAQVDIKGHVRRGDIEIPIVDDSLAPAHPATSTRHKPVIPVPTYTCYSSSTEATAASSIVDQPQPSRKTTELEEWRSTPVAGDHLRLGNNDTSIPERKQSGESPRYVDHDALYGEHPSISSPTTSDETHRWLSEGVQKKAGNAHAPISKFLRHEKDRSEPTDDDSKDNASLAGTVTLENEPKERASWLDLTPTKPTHRSVKNNINKHVHISHGTDINIKSDHPPTNKTSAADVSEAATKTSEEEVGTPSGHDTNKLTSKSAPDNYNIPTENYGSEKNTVQKDEKDSEARRDSGTQFYPGVGELQIENASPLTLTGSSQPSSQHRPERKTNARSPQAEGSVTNDKISEILREVNLNQKAENSSTRRNINKQRDEHIATKAAGHEKHCSGRLLESSRKESATTQTYAVHAEGSMEAKSRVTRKGNDKLSDNKQDKERFLESDSHMSQARSDMADSRTPRGGGRSLKELTNERDQLLRAEKTYRQRILQLEEEVKSVVKQSQELSAENKDLRSKLDALENSRKSGGLLEMRDLKREKEELVTTVARVTKEKLEVDAENERLQARLKEQDHNARLWDTISSDNNELKTQNTELEKRVQDLENDVRRLGSKPLPPPNHVDQVSAMQNENKKLEAELSNLRTQKAAVEEEVDRQKSLNADLTERLEHKRQELEELVRVLKSDTTSEKELRDLNAQLENTQGKLSEYKASLDEVNLKYQELERENGSTKVALKGKEAECKSLKVSLEEKDSQISELKRKLESSKRGMKKLEDSLEEMKQTEKDAVNMKARIRSLKNEIEDSLVSIHKLKQENNEAKTEVDRLHAELMMTSESLTEARRYIKTMEGERHSRQQMEEELQTRDKRLGELERQTFEMNVRSEQLKQKVKELEEDKQDLLKARSNATEVEVANRKLQEENQKLRQALVERNIEITRRQSERKTLVNRVDTLERKQQDADIQMQQLKGWVGTSSVVPPTGTVPDPRLSTRKDYLLGLPGVASPTLPRESKLTGARGGRGGGRGGGGGGVKHKGKNRSWDDLTRAGDHEVSAHTSPSLPVVLETRFLDAPASAAAPGYFELYKHKLTLVKSKRW